MEIARHAPALVQDRADGHAALVGGDLPEGPCEQGESKRQPEQVGSEQIRGGARRKEKLVHARKCGKDTAETDPRQELIAAAIGPEGEAERGRGEQCAGRKLEDQVSGRTLELCAVRARGR